MAEIAKCSTCGRAIIWTSSPTGARLPLDARPATGYYLRPEPGDPTPHAEPLKVAVNGEALRIYVSHFMTCPQAADHSRRGR